MNSQIGIWLKNKKSLEKTFNNYIKNGVLKEEINQDLSILHLKRARLDIEFSGYI